MFAAAEVFACRGYNGARIEEIAEVAGVSKALIYEHFKGKRELYNHIRSKGTRESLERVLKAAASSGDSVWRLQRGLAAFLDFVAEQPAVWQVIEQAVSDPEIVALDQSQQRRSERAIALLLASDAKIADQSFSPDELELLAVMMNGTAVRAANWWLEHPTVERDAILAWVMRFIWLGVERIREGASFPPPDAVYSPPPAIGGAVGSVSSPGRSRAR